MKMDPLNNLQVQAHSKIMYSAVQCALLVTLVVFISTQVAVKNNIDVFYFSVLIPLNLFFVEDGKMGMTVAHTLRHSSAFTLTRVSVN